MTRAKLIYNPACGRKAGIPLGRYSFEDVAAALSHYEIAADASATEGPGHATEIAAAAVRDGYEAILVAGGDGTVHEASQALVGTRVKLGILPLGSMMNLCRALAIPRDLEEAVRILRMGHVVAIDVGQVDGRYFLEAAGVGMDAGIIRHLTPLDHGRWDSLRELAAFLQTYRPMSLRIRVDGHRRSVRALVALVANTPYYATGVRIAPDAKINDGKLDLVVIGGVGKLGLLWRGLRSLLPGQVYPAGTRLYRGREITIEAPPGSPAHADAVELDGPCFRFRLLPRALHVYAGFPMDTAGAAFVEHRRPRIRLPFRGRKPHGDDSRQP